MARDPVADDGGELSDLKVNRPSSQGVNAEGVFVEPDLGAVITWIKTSIQPRLNKNINLRPDLGVEKQRQPRIEKVVDVTVNKSGRRLLKIVKFKIDRAAQPEPQIVMEAPTVSAASRRSNKSSISNADALLARRQKQNIGTSFISFSRRNRDGYRGVKTHFKLCPIVSRSHQSQTAAM